MRAGSLVLVLGLAGSTACRGEPPLVPRANAPCAPPEHTRDLVVLDPSAPTAEAASQSKDETAGIQRVLVCSRLRAARHGVVVDGTTGAPIAGAVVKVESWQLHRAAGALSPERRLLRSAEARSDAEGAWSLGEEWAWMQGLLTAGGFPVVIERVSAGASGYAPFLFDPLERADDAVGGLPSKIALQRLPATMTRDSAQR